MAKRDLYFVAIIPEQKVKDAIMDTKQQLADKYHCKSALKSPPHITLHMPFQWRSDREDQLIEQLKAFEFDEFPQEIQLKNYGFFEPGVVYVDVIPDEQLTKLQNELVNYMKRTFNLFNANYKDMPFHPHVTIAFRDIKKSLFPFIKQEYEAKQYAASFQTKGFCLLKHNGKHWEEFVDIPARHP